MFRRRNCDHIPTKFLELHLLSNFLLNRCNSKFLLWFELTFPHKDLNTALVTMYTCYGTNGLFASAKEFFRVFNFAVQELGLIQEPIHIATLVVHRSFVLVKLVCNF